MGGAIGNATRPHGVLRVARREGRGGEDPPEFVDGLYAAPSARSTPSSVAPHTIHSDPLHTDAGSCRRCTGGSGNLRHTSVAGSYAVGVTSMVEPPASHGHTISSVPVHTEGERTLTKPGGEIVVPPVIQDGVIRLGAESMFELAGHRSP